MSVEKSVKAVVYNSDKGLVIVLVRGDHEVNEIKVQNHLGALFLEMANEEAIQAAGTVAGFIGGVGKETSLCFIR